MSEQFKSDIDSAPKVNPNVIAAPFAKTIANNKRIRFWFSFLMFVLFYVVLLPFTLGYYFSWIFIRVIRWIQGYVGRNGNDLGSARFHNTIVLFISLLIIIILTWFAIFVTMTDRDFLLNKTYVDPVKYGETINTNRWLAWIPGFLNETFKYFIIGFFWALAVTFFIKIIMMFLFNEQIKQAKIKDEKEAAKLIGTGVKYVSPHPWYKFIGKSIDFKYGEKLFKHYEALRIKKLIAVTIKSGQIVSKVENIMFFKDFWKYHAVFAGGARAGITNNVMSLVASAAYQKFPIIYLDSDFNPETQNNFRRISEQEGAPLITIDFTNPEVKYNIFKGKNPDQIAQMITYAFNEFIEDKTTGFKLTYIIVNLIHNDSDFPMTLDSIIQFMDFNFLAAKFDPTLNFDLFAIINTDGGKELLHEIKHNIIRFNSVYGQFIDYNLNTLGASDILSSNNTILYFVIPNQFPGVLKRAIYRFVFKDVLSLSSVGARYRQQTDKTALFFLHGVSDLFIDQGDVTNSLSKLTINRIGVSIEIKAGTFRPEYLPIVKDIFLNAKTFFVHKTNDEMLVEAVKNALGTTRAVKPGYENDEIYWGEYRNPDGYMNFTNMTKDEILHNVNNLANWGMYFKTISYTCLGKTNVSKVKFDNIIYNDPIISIPFEETLHEKI